MPTPPLMFCGMQTVQSASTLPNGYVRFEPTCLVYGPPCHKHRPCLVCVPRMRAHAAWQLPLTVSCLPLAARNASAAQVWGCPARSGPILCNIPTGNAQRAPTGNVLPATRLMVSAHHACRQEDPSVTTDRHHSR